MATSVTFEQINNLAKKGVSGTNAAKQLGIAYHQMYYILEKENTKYSDLVNTKTPNEKAWETINRNKAIELYKNSESSGIKASINRKFKAEHGVDINTFIKAKEVKVKQPKAKESTNVNKQAFNLKDVALKLPYSVRIVIEALTKRVEELEAKK
jgi:hypothetical protein